MIIIYCAGNQGRVVLDILFRTGVAGENIIYIDDKLEPGTSVNGVDVVGGHETFKQFDPNSDQCIVAIGGEHTDRLKLVQIVKRYGFGFHKAVDPDSTISSTAVTSDGIMLNARTYVGPDVHIGPHVLIDSCVNISHDTYIEAGATIAPNVTLSGNVTVGKNGFLGAGAVVLDEVSIGKNATVGAGAVVTSDVQSNTTVAGIPAKKI